MMTKETFRKAISCEWMNPLTESKETIAATLVLIFVLTIYFLSWFVPLSEKLY